MNRGSDFGVVKWEASADRGMLLYAWSDGEVEKGGTR